ncbi:ABC transporter permease [Rheinheimera sp. D18]|uniref:ABC transporter permease n=1 Tax=Rheinheimera sp. D18 TaxID=2545632 RepID=UPI0010443F54|nr:ABC transporter permease [Rheinheimera sp. D18]QBL10710.1 ABC transporter permease [Rheinheimera sp. D18]
MRLWALLSKEWRLLCRDIHALAVLFLMPLTFVLLMAFALSDLNSGTPATASVSLLQHADDADSRFFAAALAEQITVLTTVTDTTNNLTQVVTDKNFSELLNQEATSTLPQLQLIFPASTVPVLRQQVRSAVILSLAQTRLHAFLSANEMLSDEQSLTEQLAIVRQQTDSTITELDLGTKGQVFGQASASQHSVPAWLIFGMFFVMLPMANTLLAEQQSGTLLRLKSAGLPPLTLALGKCLPYFMINLLQFALLLTVSYLLLPVLGLAPLQFNGSPVAYLVLASSIALCSSCFGFLIASLVRSNEQALMLSGGCNIILAAVGGIMVPTVVMPEAMQQVAALSPMNWALEGCLTLLTGHGDIVDIMPSALKLVLFALSSFALAYFIYKYKMSRIKWTAIY